MRIVTCFVGIVTCLPGESSPVIQCLEKLKQLGSELGDPKRDVVWSEMAVLFDELNGLCGDKGNAAIAAKNGAVELACSLCSKIPSGSGCEVALVSALKALASLLHGEGDLCIDFILSLDVDAAFAVCIANSQI